MGKAVVVAPQPTTPAAEVPSAPPVSHKRKRGKRGGVSRRERAAKKNAAEKTTAAAAATPQPTKDKSQESATSLMAKPPRKRARKEGEGAFPAAARPEEGGAKRMKMKKKEKKALLDGDGANGKASPHHSGTQAAEEKPTKSGEQGQRKRKRKNHENDTAASGSEASATPEQDPQKRNKNKKKKKKKNTMTTTTTTANTETDSSSSSRKKQRQDGALVSEAGTLAARADGQRKTTKKKKKKKETPSPASPIANKQSQPQPPAAAADLDHILMEHLGQATPASAGTKRQHQTSRNRRKEDVHKKAVLRKILRGQAHPAKNSDSSGDQQDPTIGGQLETRGAKKSMSTTKKSSNEDTRDSTTIANGTDKSEKSLRGSPTMSKLQKRMQARLTGSRFRWINERLYTSTGSEALRLAKKDPSIFEEYHKGFTRQVELWPENPVDIFIAQLQRMPKSVKVADMGCGDAKIAQSVEQKVHSFDLVSNNKWVTACDIAKVPLKNDSVDVVIFCLSLMGTNLVDFINEAHRILTSKGTLKIAEVKSRFDDVEKFVLALYALGFDLLEQDDHNKMFILFDFQKSSRPRSAKANLTLKPCIYKKR